MQRWEKSTETTYFRLTVLNYYLMNKIILSIALFFLFLTKSAYSQLAVGLDLGVEFLSNKSLNALGVTPFGFSPNLRFGLMSSKFEFGAYVSNRTISASVTHDNEKATIKHQASSTGTYFNYYASKYFVTLSVGKSVINQSIDSSALTDGQKIAAKRAYGFEQEEFTTSEYGYGIGFKVWKLKSSVHSVLFKRTVIQKNNNFNDGIYWSVQYKL